MSNEDSNNKSQSEKKFNAIEYLNYLISESNNPSDIEKLEKISKMLNSKKYGLVWEEHPEKVEEEMKSKIPVFLENKCKKIHDSDSEDFNFLLEGDNLHSLHLLEKTHLGKIDVIYIDPPYNTGNKDFKYNDSFVDEDDKFRHSKWLSFMERRLKIAKKLLSENGVIFISIDNKEGYQLKLLLDEIFGYKNMAADLHVETSAVAGPRRFAAMNGSVVKTTEFVFAYSNGNTQIIKRPLYDSVLGYDTHYSKFDDTDKGIINLSDKINSELKIKNEFLNAHLKVDMPSLNKLIQVNSTVKNWIYSEDISKRIFRIGDKLNSVNSEDLSTLSSHHVKRLNNKYVILNKNNNPVSIFRYYDRIGTADDYFNSYGERTLRGNLWKGFSSDGGNLSSEGGVKFKNGKKPKRLIKQLIETCTSGKETNVNVLDFFAGSGTTAESVMELNNENKGNYRFILANNDEVIDTTYQRMVNINKEVPMNLKYFKTDFIDKNTDDLETKLLSNIKALVELKHGVDLNRSDIAIVNKRDDLNKLDLSKISTIYMRSQTHKMLNRELLKELVDIDIIDIPETFFAMEMKEAGL
ncbi:type iii restriction-modification system methylation subunit [Apilactobacillus ozensis DSM 23829 = JCM 17196]|uniref:Type iii restriction-modification system methylation subunit n=1 Tax=Apilactobacillus ozensis DSM 23829 = JCM 17196 TaxID=1423781 RepID=A0A0R2AMP0_9LACO|nr:site-specific DNA-methyltransferase [Apilactobacillus ozensis]KRM67746.1 type iii restriction-modification system methylation subunit [Apilactobacillus ozensis DSM 23829 = JCM 17196]